MSTRQTAFDYVAALLLLGLMLVYLLAGMRFELGEPRLDGDTRWTQAK